MVTCPLGACSWGLVKWFNLITCPLGTSYHSLRDKLPITHNFYGVNRMLNINFVPDDYIQSNESRRTNLLYIVLFVVVMVALGGSFVTIKVRQHAFHAKEKLVNTKITRVQQAIKQLEQLEIRQKEMMKAALTTAQLLEPVPRSVLLASLTNNLPSGVSLLRLFVEQKEPKQTRPPVPTNKYQAAQADSTLTQEKLSTEQLLETHIEIEGMAPSDLQVASYIEQLSSSHLLQNVALVESKEYNIDDTTFRRFKLTAMLGKNIHLTKKDVDLIRAGHEGALRSF